MISVEFCCGIKRGGDDDGGWDSQGCEQIGKKQSKTARINKAAVIWLQVM